MTAIFRSLAILAIAVLAICGCSHGNSNPIQTGNTVLQKPPTLTAGTGRTLLGVWSIRVSPGAQPIVKLNRTITGHVNFSQVIPAPLVSYQPVDPDAQTSPDYNPNFAEFRADLGVIWHLNISLISATTMYDTRGIILTGDAVLGLHNADGLTTIWDEENEENPFKYYGSIPGPTRIFDVEFAPPVEFMPNCNDPIYKCSQNPTLAIDPQDYFAPQEVWFNFAVDACIGGPCEEPYAITYRQWYSGSPANGDVHIIVSVSDHQPGTVSSVQLDASEVPGYGLVDLVHSGGDWTTTLHIEGLTHETIYNAKVIAKSSLTLPPDPYDNPDTLYKDVRVLVGDFAGLLNAMFSPLSPSLVQDVKEEWTDREEGIYHANSSDEFKLIAAYPDGGKHYVLISHAVGGNTHYGVVRVPPVISKPLDGWPIMVSCHAGRWVCDDGADTNAGSAYEYYASHKNQFVEVIPVYRGNGLCWNDSEYQTYNDNDNSPADKDVDDVLAFLHVVRMHESEIALSAGWDEGIMGHPLMDTTRVGIMGGSRGGSPTYLAKLRDTFYYNLGHGNGNEIDRAIVVFGSVTDWFSQDIKTSCQHYISNDGYVPEDVRHYYNEDYSFFKMILERYLSTDPDIHITFEEARYRMLLSSPRWMAKDGNNYVLNHVQINHGEVDAVVRKAQSDVMSSVLSPPLLSYSEYHWYPGQGHVPGMTTQEGAYPWDKYNHIIDLWLDHVIDGD